MKKWKKIAHPFSLIFVGNRHKRRKFSLGKWMDGIFAPSGIHEL
jgi:hypothetical protein